MKVNQINLFSFITLALSIVVGIIFQKSLYALFVFVGLETIGLLTFYFVCKYKSATDNSGNDKILIAFPIIWASYIFQAPFH